MRTRAREWLSFLWNQESYIFDPTNRLVCDFLSSLALKPIPSLSSSKQVTADGESNKMTTNNKQEENMPSTNNINHDSNLNNVCRTINGTYILESFKNIYVISKHFSECKFC